MEVTIEDPATPDIRALLEEHLAEMFATTPACSVHALDVEALRRPEITFFALREDGLLLGCGALKELEPSHGEIKSMRTAHSARGRGVAARVLDAIVDTARTRGYSRLSLETGTEDFFAPARRLYLRHGFVECPPFADYVLDPLSVFMRLDMRPLVT